MKNKTVIILLSVLAVLLYTVAVINFCLGNVLSGIAELLMASSDALIAYTLYRVGQLGRMADAMHKALIGLLEQFTKGIPATLDIKGNKGTITFGTDDDGDPDTGEASEVELTEEEERKLKEEMARQAEENKKLTAERG
jgi:hypothetical protein